jgi:hypothetical protein
MKTKSLLIVLLTGLIISSCQKEADLQGRGGEVNEKVLGTWNFVAMDVDLATEITDGSGIDEQKMQTHYVMASTNNKGTITFDKTKAVSENISYSYNTMVDVRFYIGGILDDEFQMPMIGDMPVSHGISEYNGQGEDSLHFAKGFTILDAPDSQGGPVTREIEPITIGLGWAQDTMVLTADVTRIQRQVVNGFNTDVKYKVRQVVKLKK